MRHSNPTQVFGNLFYCLFFFLRDMESSWSAGTLFIENDKCDTPSSVIPSKLCSNSRSRIWVEWEDGKGKEIGKAIEKEWCQNKSYRLIRLYHLEMSVWGGTACSVPEGKIIFLLVSGTWKQLFTINFKFTVGPIQFMKWAITPTNTNLLQTTVDSYCIKSTWNRKHSVICFHIFTYFLHNWSKIKTRKTSRTTYFFGLFCTVAHRFHFDSIFWCLLSRQVETQHLIGQFTNNSRTKGNRSGNSSNSTLLRNAVVI